MKGDRSSFFRGTKLYSALKYRYVKLSRNYETRGGGICVMYHCVIYPSTGVRSIKRSFLLLLKKHELN